MSKQTKFNWKTLYTLVKETKPPKVAFTVAVPLSVISTIAGLAIPILTSQFIDSFSLTQLPLSIIFSLVIVIILQAVGDGFSVYYLTMVGQHVISELRKTMLQKLMFLPVSYYDDHETGDSVSRAINDTGIIRDLITTHVVNFFTGILSIIGTIFVLFYLDWPLALVMFTILPLSIFIILPIGKRMAQVSKELQRETANYSSLLTKVLSEIRLVKASNAEKQEWENGSKGIQQLYHIGVKEGFYQALLSPLVSTFMIFALIGIIGYGGLRVSTDAMTAGTLVAFFIYLFQIIVPITQVAHFFTQLQKTVGATEKVVNILQEDVEDVHKGQSFPTRFTKLSLEDINFSYNNDRSILQNVSIKAEAGKVTAIVGPSGSGKTTIFGLVERFYHPSGGGILLDDQAIQHFSLKEWRQAIGYVSQDSPVYAGTIRDNLVYGLEENPTEEEITTALHQSYAYPFIQDLPNGLETEVGERGVKLSGGQKQRLAIARAILRDPKILLLDEATSSLDSQSEQVVQNALKNLMNGRTTLVIAHRLSTIIDADSIVFLDKGVVTGTGTHEELMLGHRKYKEFATQQLRLIEE